MKRTFQWMTLLIAFLLTLYAFPFSLEKPTKETIIFFPIDRTASFTKTATTLQAQPQKPHGPYSLLWTVSSSLNRNAYLRQDISLLFADGQLIGTLSKWNENNQTLLQEGEIKQKDSHFFQAISFHYGEIHRDHKITSTQSMSGDYLYVIASPYDPFTSFRRGKTAAEKEWQRVLTKTTTDFLQYNAKTMLDDLAIHVQNYYHFYLPELLAYNEQPFPDLSLEKTQKIIGNLWEGLYKNYFLGVKQKDGTIVSPIGSTMPLLLISKDYSHLIVLTKTKNGETVQLLQQISP
ncbi:hypothetical protein [Anoxybacillus sp. J5B_2022]|uniref:hypothetical protein n=1 Tax=Anoxybacillus sp. J5B_2022 TaxID=3003246 RepID=UPI0022854CCB|nr:hypothetical protein [Anoxybacillus sp. J5B_2022]MCZ0754624.1 hypothetical protein [Anoxybacillus sp. J5B_2022]